MYVSNIVVQGIPPYLIIGNPLFCGTLQGVYVCHSKMNSTVAQQESDILGLYIKVHYIRALEGLLTDPWLMLLHSLPSLYIHRLQKAGLKEKSSYSLGLPSCGT